MNRLLKNTKGEERVKPTLDFRVGSDAGWEIKRYSAREHLRIAEMDAAQLRQELRQVEAEFKRMGSDFAARKSSSTYRMSLSRLARWKRAIERELGRRGKVERTSLREKLVG